MVDKLKCPACQKSDALRVNETVLLTVPVEAKEDGTYTVDYDAMEAHWETCERSTTDEFWCMRCYTDFDCKEVKEVETTLEEEVKDVERVPTENQNQKS